MLITIKRDSSEDVRSLKKENEKLKMIPVVVLTVSKAEEDVIKSYKLHANCYITKPIDLAQFAKVARAVQDFWLTIVKLPPKE